jgi:hypothetical protein
MYYSHSTTAARRRSADFQSAVSQICNLQTVRRGEDSPLILSAADYKSAIQQIENLRYGDCPSRQALLHRQFSGAAHKRAFTGFFNT